MTCVVALVTDAQTVVMGGDCAANDDEGSITLRDDPKVFIKDDFIIGFCGSFRIGQLVQYVLEVPTYCNQDPMEYMVVEFVGALRALLKHQGGLKDDAMEASLLVGFRGELYEIHGDFQIGRPSLGYAAIGSGAAVALGSLHATLELIYITGHDAVELALNAAQKNSSGVSAPFCILEV